MDYANKDEENGENKENESEENKESEKNEENLMKKCWDEDPLKRPSSKEVLNIIEEWIILPYEKEIEDISKELKSRVLDFTSKKLNKYLESECLDNCRISNDINSLDIETDEN
ncbi:kinase-like domain-containing protein [Rhizophagus irregularis DAOM 181602=DAOM 197198]|nr:kinase-like domain-containing protein [Rhizophagus irregularis DAOM 181602=DAOM 197198]